MKILRYFLFTILYVLVIELSSVWILILYYFDLEIPYYFELIQGFIQLIITLSFFYFLYNDLFLKLFIKPKYKWIILAILLGCIFVPLQTPLNLFYNLLIGTEYYFNYDFDRLSNLTNLNTITTIILIPVAEELIFRGFIQTKLQREIKPFPAIFIASILFALMHAPYLNLLYTYFEMTNFTQDWHLSYIALFGGILSGFIYFKSKSIIPSIIFHMLWNFFATIF